MLPLRKWNDNTIRGKLLSDVIDSIIRQTAHELGKGIIYRVRERRITKDDVRNAIFNGEIIEDRPEDIPIPCCLILGATINGRFLHVICGMLDNMADVITAYYLDPDRWESDFSTKRGKRL